MIVVATDSVAGLVWWAYPNPRLDGLLHLMRPRDRRQEPRAATLQSRFLLGSARKETCSLAFVFLLKKKNAGRGSAAAPQAVRASAFDARCGLAYQTLELSTYFEAKNASVKYAKTSSVISVGNDIAHVCGLANVQAGEMVVFACGLCGMALNLTEDNVGVVIFGKDVDIFEGDAVQRTSAIVDVPIGDKLLGLSWTASASPSTAGPASARVRVRAHTHWPQGRGRAHPHLGPFPSTNNVVGKKGGIY